MATILTPYQSETHGIVITVMPAFLAHESDPAANKFMWGYAIRIRNTTEHSVQLRDRHWIIYDALGRKEEVRGEGVVGDQPILKPGGFYDYNSGVPLTTPSGLMRGQYRFTNTDGSEFWVDIPAFSLDSPHDGAAKHLKGIQMIPVKTLKCGYELPVLGLGTWRMGGDKDKNPSPQDALDVKAIRAAVELGFRHIDTAEIYAAGYTEDLVGEAIRSLDRNDIFLASKAAHGNHTADRLEKSLHQSLERLGTDYLDLYYLHRPTLETPFEQTAVGLNKLYKQGRIKSVGVCNFSKENLDRLQSYLDMKIVANQVHYNLVFREPETSGLLQHAAENDYFIVAWRPLRFTRRKEESSVSADAWEKGAFPLLDALAKKYQKTNVQIALNWLAHQPQTVMLVKSSQTLHLQEAASSFDWTLTTEDYRTLSENFEPTFAISDTIPLV